MLAFLLALASGLAQDNPSDPFVERAVAAGKELLDGAAGARRRELLRVLAQYATDRNPSVSRPSLNAAAAFCREAVAAERSEDLGSAMNILIGSTHPERDAVLRSILESKMEGWLRVQALDALAGSGGPAFVPKLKRDLKDQDLKFAAAELLGRTLKDSGDAEVLALLKAEGETTRDPDDLGTIAFAMRSIGGKSTRDVFKAWLDRLEGWNRAEAAWFVHGVDPIKAIQRLAELGLIDRLTDERLSWILDGLARDRNVSSCMVRAINDSGTLVHVNAAAFEPLRYDQRIEGFRDHRKKLFSPTKPRQSQGADGRLVVEFDHGERTYSFTPRDLGTWYDLPPLIDAMNRALIDADVKERYVGIRAPAQFGTFALVDPEAMATAARELHLPLEPDPDAGRKAWLKALERASGKPK
jgi:hypothetical protein